MAKIGIAAGHGGRDSGALYGNRFEEDYTLQVSKSLAEKLRGAGHTILEYRTVDTDYNLSSSARVDDVANWANKNEVNYLLDLHFNFGGGEGSECYYSKFKFSAEGKRLAELITQKLERLGLKNRGAKVKINSTGTADYFGVIRQAKMVANLAECAFIDNDKDMQKANTDDVASCIAEAIVAVFGGQLKPKQEPTLYAVGDKVRYSSYYTNPNAPIFQAKGANAIGNITAIVSGRNQYQLDRKDIYCNNGDIREKITVPPFPGAVCFKPGANNENVLLLGQQLIKKGYGKHYKVGASRKWGEADRLNVQDFQKAQGWRGSDADGYPGPETWKRLFS